ncbi:MAG: IPTL-CTERM sorting domain-containing protein [Acidobacteriota bacterium]
MESLSFKGWVAAALLTCTAAVGWVGGVAADEVVLEPSADATLYADDADLANGAGDHLFTGRGNDFKRSLVRFDVSTLPAGSTVDSVELTLHLSRTIVSGITQEVFRVERGWSEGPTDAPGQEGIGGTSQTGDVTWVHTSFDTELWDSPGGDVADDPSAELLVGDDIGDYTFASTPALVSDVQGWVDDPSSNFGWQIQGFESFLLRSAKRFDSREHPDPARRPRLRVVFTAPVTPTTEIPTLGAAGVAALSLLLLAGGVAALRRWR